jgi:uncharacterized repeat protein (TIGR01451 family)
VSPALGAAVDQVTLCEGTGCDGADIRIQGSTTAPSPQFGFSTAMGYLNGDLFADLVVGAPESGEVYIFFGGADNCSPGEGAAARDLSASRADVILTAPGFDDFGFALAIAGNPDPLVVTSLENTLVIGAPAIDEAQSQAGAAFAVPAGTFVWPGGALAVPPATNPITCPATPTAATNISGGPGGIYLLEGEENGDLTGYAVAAGRVTSALADDIIVSARNRSTVAAPAASNMRGEVYVVPAGTSTDMSGMPPVTLSDIATIRISGSVDDEGLGESLLIVGDQLPAMGNEFAIGAVGALPSDTNNPPGRVYLVSSGAVTSPVDLSAMPAPAGVVAVQGSSQNDFFGFSMTAGDFDDDNLTPIQLAISAIYEENNPVATGCLDPVTPAPSQKSAGAVYIFDPPVFGPLNAPPAADGVSSHIFWGEHKWDELGFALAAGDVNDDDIVDLLISARWHDRNLVLNEVDEGAVYVFHGDDAGWPSCLDCATAACSTNPPGVDAMLFGGDAVNNVGEEIGFSIAAGDFNQSSAFADIALSSITHNRVYLATLNNQDTLATEDGQVPDPAGEVRRDIRDRDDDGDGYLDVDEDFDLDGAITGNESDPLVPNRDAGVTLAPLAQSVNCDLPFDVVIRVNNASAALSIDPPTELQMQATWDRGVFVYQSGTTTVATNGGAPQAEADVPGTCDISGGTPGVCTAPATRMGDSCVTNADCGGFPFYQVYRQVTSSPDPIPMGTVFDIEFQLSVVDNPGVVATSRIDAQVQQVTNELADGHPGINAAPNNTNTVPSLSQTVTLLCPDLTVDKTCPAAPVIAGTQATFMIDVANSNGGNASADAQGVVVTDTLPAGVTLAVTGQETCTAAGGTWSQTTATAPTCTFTTIALGAMETFNVTVDVASSVPIGPLDNDVAVISSNKEKDATGTPGGNADTCTLNVDTEADLDVTGSSDAPDPVVAGATLTYTVEVDNATGPSDAQNVVVTHMLDADVIVQAAQASGTGCTGAGGAWDETAPAPGTPTMPTCTFTTVAQGATPTYDVSVTVMAGATGPLSTTVSVTTATNDPDAANNTINLMTGLTTVADLTIAKMGPGSAVAGLTDDLIYSLTVNNLGPSVVPGSETVTVTDTLPLGTSGWVAMGTNWNCLLSGGTPEVVTCTRQGALGLGNASAITLTGTVDPDTPGPLTNNATVSSAIDANAGNNTSADVMTMIATSADLDVTGSSDTPDPVVAGTMLTYTVEVDNTAGPSDAQTVVVTHMLDADVTLVGTSGDDCGTQGGTWDATTPTAPTCTFATVAQGATPTYDVPVMTSAGAIGPLSTTVSVASATADPAAGNDSTALTTAVSTSADLDVTGSSDTPDPVVAGTMLTYTVEVDNTAGPSDAQTVVVTHMLDADVTLVGTSGDDCGTQGGTWDATTPTAPTCTFATVAQGATPTYDVPVMTSAGAIGPLSTTVSVASATADPAAGNDSTALTTAVSTSADLDVTGSSHSPDPVAPLGTLTYMVDVNNTAGPSDAQNVVVTHTLDADVAVQAAQASGAGCSGAGGTWDETTPTAPTCTFTTVAQGAAPTYGVPVDVSVAAVGSLTTTVSVTSATSDPNLGNNDAVLTTNVTFAPPAEVVITVDADAVGWTNVPGAGMYNLYRGNLSALRGAGIYTQDPGVEPTAGRICDLVASSESEVYMPPLGEAVFYLVSSDNGMVEGSLGRNSAGVERTNDNPCP